MLIQDYDPNWPKAFTQLATVLTKAAGKHLSTIEHVGSTAVPGLAAKPIIDIDLVYPIDGDFEALKAALETSGYYHNADQGILGREVFKRHNATPLHPILDTIAHHLYACRADNAELRRHLAFRDHLRAQPEARAAYEALKREVARLAGEERKAYPALKEVRARDFVASILAGTASTSTAQTEVSLSGGRSTESVVKVGTAVHRTQHANAKFIHALLRILEKEHYPFSPRFRGIDAKGREILSFIEGSVPNGVVLGKEQVVTFVRMLRSLHDAVAGQPICGDAETICHNDFAPWNVLIKDGVPVGVIDFDEAAPGKRVDDLAYFIWTFLDVGNTNITSSNMIKGIAHLIDAYDLDTEGRVGFVNALLQQQQRILIFRKLKVKQATDPEELAFNQRAVGNIERSMDWVRRNTKQIAEAVCA